MACNDHFVPDELTSPHHKVSQSTHPTALCCNCQQQDEQSQAAAAALGEG